MNMNDFELSYFTSWLLKFGLNHRTAVNWRTHRAWKDLWRAKNGLTAQRGNFRKAFIELLRGEAA